MPKKREYIAISGYIVDSHLYPKGEQVIAALDDGAMIDHRTPSRGFSLVDYRSRTGRLPAMH
jgi:hypothetical protein